MKFSSYLLAIFLPPIYLFTRKHYIGGTFNLILWLVAWMMLLTMVLAPIAVGVWFFCFIQAAWYLKQEMVELQTTMLASKIANSMGKANQQQGSDAT